MTLQFCLGKNLKLENFHWHALDVISSDFHLTNNFIRRKITEKSLAASFISLSTEQFCSFRLENSQNNSTKMDIPIATEIRTARYDWKRAQKLQEIT